MDSNYKAYKYLDAEDLKQKVTPQNTEAQSFMKRINSKFLDSLDLL